MNEERRQILQMLADDKITADEAERLISALERERPESPPGTALSPAARPKYLRMMMNADDGIGGTSRLNVRVPLKLLRAGVRLTSLIPPQVLTKINTELDRKGVPVDLTELKPQHIEDLIEGLDDLTFDLDDPDNKMRIYCE